MVKDILSVSGYPGLYKLVSQARNTVIVESLADGKRMPVYASSRISALDDISIYTEEGEKHLVEVFIDIFNKELKVDPKSDVATLKEKFKEVVPDYDQYRVYPSDIKKVFAWFNILKEKEYITKEKIESHIAEKEKVKEAEGEKAAEDKGNKEQGDKDS